MNRTFTLLTVAAATVIVGGGTAAASNNDSSPVTVVWQVPLTSAEWNAAGQPTGPAHPELWPQVRVAQYDGDLIDNGHTDLTAPCGIVYQVDVYKASDAKKLGDVLDRYEDKGMIDGSNGRNWAMINGGECEPPPTTIPAPKKVDICHRDQGKPEWKVITISESALPAHLAHQWGEDIYPVPAEGCPTAPTTTVPETTLPPVTTLPPTTVPETTVPATTLPPTTTVPAVTTTTVEVPPPPVPTTTLPGADRGTTVPVDDNDVCILADGSSTPNYSDGPGDANDKAGTLSTALTPCHVDVPNPTPTTAPSLPVTGGTTEGIILIATLSTVAGVAALVARRRPV